MWRSESGCYRNFCSKTKYFAMQVYKLCIRALQISIPKKVYPFTTRNFTFLTSKDEILHCSRSNYNTVHIRLIVKIPVVLYNRQFYAFINYTHWAPIHRKIVMTLPKTWYNICIHPTIRKRLKKLSCHWFKMILITCSLII